MHKGLFVCEDSFLLDRIRTGFSDYPDLEFLFASTSDEAVELAKENEIAICCIKLETEVLSGDEVVDIVIDENPEVRFVFIYEERNIELAVEMFNLYDGSRILSIESFSVEMLKELFDDEMKLYNAENNLHEEAKAYREREKAYMDSMAEMSGVLNQRVECYKSIVKMYVAGIEMVMPKFSKEEAMKIRAFLENELWEYVNRFVVSSFDKNIFVDSLVSDLNKTDMQKHFQIFGKDAIPNDDLGFLICYAIHFISHAFCDFLEKYRTKVEIKVNSSAIKMDFLVDTRLGNVREEFLDEYMLILNDIVVVLCEKCERGAKDGIVQYRFYYIKENSISED